MVMTAASQTRVFPFLRKKENTDGPPRKPPKQGTTSVTPPQPNCDKCHVAPAVYEVIVGALKLFFCGHHFRQNLPEFVSKGYEFHKL